VKIADSRTSRSITVLGGIGWDWVDAFEAALKDGTFN
jgi:hypothetical protein